ncbi:hypothetical protein ACSAZK_16645 [Methanosarcina sp. Mfa9]|uniref:hypothetical protein n=1 Tax=Methanosarcina sp. Mfa9 TaxID=3439063 RepID=UPI003F86463F
MRIADPLKSPEKEAIAAQKRNLYIPAPHYYFHLTKRIFLDSFKRRITIMDFKAILALLVFCVLYFIYHYSAGAIA